MPRQLPPIETRFKKGQSGNPKGKPKGVMDRRTIIREMYKMFSREGEVDGKKYKMNGKQLMIMKQFQKAIEDGDNTSFKMLMDYEEGEAEQNINTKELNKDEKKAIEEIEEEMV